VRESALQTASSILSLQRRVDEEIRALNKALQQRSEELATANIELQRQTETAHAQARAFAEKIGLALQRSPADPARR
jgi:two-component sensor histidine kinase